MNGTKGSIVAASLVLLLWGYSVSGEENQVVSAVDGSDVLGSHPAFGEHVIGKREVDVDDSDTGDLDKRPYDSRMFVGKRPYNSRMFVGKRPYDNRMFIGKRPYSGRMFVGKRPYSGRMFVGKRPYSGRMFVGKRPYSGRMFVGKRPLNERVFSVRPRYNGRMFLGKRGYDSRMFLGKREDEDDDYLVVDDDDTFDEDGQSFNPENLDKIESILSAAADQKEDSGVSLKALDKIKGTSD